MNFGSFDMTSTAMQRIPCNDQRVTSNTTTATHVTSSSAGATRRPSVPKCIDKTKILLSDDFQPSDYSIICGNKRKYFNSVGNSRLRVLVKSFIPQFSQAEGKLEKGMIVSKVMNIVKEACPVGAFVTMEKGKWWQVSERTSREKVGSLFRDFLSNKYKSSAQNKIARRKSKREEKKQDKSMPLRMDPLPMMPESVASLPPLQPQAMLHQHNHNDGEDSDASVSSASCSFYDVDDLTAVQLEEL